MTRRDHPLLQRIETALGVAVKSHQGLSVGFGLTGLSIVLEDGRKAAVKADSDPDSDALELEGYMLHQLGALCELPTPEVYHASGDMLIMSWLASGGAITPEAQRHAGELIAALHAAPRPHFGFERDTLIGPLHQPNPPAGTWLPFFRDHRLLFMAETARKSGQLPANEMNRIENLAARLDEFIDEPKHPSLLHGDLWGGNVIAHNNRISGFIDPAIYFGHPEIELAFTTLFNTFSQPFFDSYAAHFPIEPGFHEERCDLYNLYPVLVHVTLFGAGYLGDLDRKLSRFGF